MAHEQRLNLQYSSINSNEDLEALFPHIQNLEEHVVEQNINYEAKPLNSLLTHLDYEKWFIVCIWHDKTLLGLFPLQEIKRLPLPIFQCTTLYKDHPVSCTPLVHRDYADDVIDHFWLWFNEKARILYVADSLSDSSISNLWLSGAGNRNCFVSLSNTTDRAIAHISGLDFIKYAECNFSHRLKKSRQQNLRKLDALGGFKTTVTSSNHCVRSQIDHLIAVEGSEWKVVAGSAITSNANLEKYVRDIAGYAASRNRIFLITSSVGDLPAGAMFGLLNDKRLYIYKIGYNTQFSKYSIGILTLVSLIEHAMSDSSIHLLDSCAASDVEIYNRCFPDKQVCNQYQVASNHLLPKLCILVVRKTRTLRVKCGITIGRTRQLFERVSI